MLPGAGRIGTGEGAIDGVVVATSDEQHLEIPLTILLCGDRMEYCQDLVSPEDTWRIARRVT